MAKFVRRFSKRIFIVANIILVAIFLLACLNGYLNPTQWWWIAVLGLGIPFLLVLNIAFILFWLIFRSRWVFLSLAALLLSIGNIKTLIAFNFNSTFQQQKDSSHIRILTWNVSWFDEQRKNDKLQKSKRKEMLAYIQSENADILCFQEFLESNREKNPSLYSNLEDLSKMGYPYSFFSRDYATAWGAYNAGPVIVSRYPLVATYKINYQGPKQLRAAESLIGVDIDINGRYVRVYTTHLQSILLQKDDYRNIEIIRNADDSIVEASKSILKKLKSGYFFRGQQANIVRRELSKSPFPVIICGDFNDVPNSYTYSTIKGDLQDAYLKKGTGLGRTYKNLAPTLRIDYIFADPRLQVVQVKRAFSPYSDHYPVVADLSWK